ncbi:MAG: PLP-dependent aminotransferase family protein [Solirubrobacteraceae bacterium]
MKPRPAARTTGLNDPLMQTFQSALGQPGMMSFGAGFMNPVGFDVTGVRAAFAAALADREVAASLQYARAEGSERLRAAIVERMAALEVPARTDELIVTSGATQALDLLCRALLDPGDVVLVERPAYVISLKQFTLAEARLVSVPGDEEGLDPAALEAAVIAHHPKAIYTIPTFQNPGGTTLPRGRREAVVEIAQRHGVWVIEDDPYRELRYGPVPPAPIASHTRDGVIYIGTLAKTVAPGLRVGWVLVPQQLIGVCRSVKQTLDMHTSAIDQNAAGVYLENVDWVQRTAELRAVYGDAMRAMVEGLARVMPVGSHWTSPGGGVFVWATLAPGWSTRELLDRALAHGMFFMPGQAFLADVSDDSTLRLSISNHTPDTIAEGLIRLAAAIEELRAPTTQAG